jgi:N4-gp56 family major capsid protein
VITYNNPASRIGKVKGETLAHAVPVEVLGIAGTNKPMPKKSGNTIVFRRWLPFGGATTSALTINQWIVSAAAHVTQEGVTPPADSLTPQDITVVMNQFSCLYMYTDVQEDLGEDDMAPELKKQTGERMGLVREMIRYGAVKQCTNVYYSGGTSRATVNATVTYNLLSKISRSLVGNHGKPITRILAPSPNFNTAPVESGFLVFCHSDLEHDIRQLPNFKEVAAYGSRKPVHDLELGSSGRYRFIISPELAGYPDSGAAVGTTGLNSTTGANVDVYPMIVVAEESWGEVALRGSNSFDLTNLPPGQKDKQDPLGQRGYVGAKFYSAATVLNSGWMAIAECGITNLS